MLRRKGSNSREFSRAMSVPSNQIWPASGVSRRTTHRATVDFPDPDAPTKASVFPAPISRATSDRAAIGVRAGHMPRQYCFDRLRTRSIALLEEPELGSLLIIFKATHGTAGFGEERSRRKMSALLHPISTTGLKVTAGV